MSSYVAGRLAGEVDMTPRGYRGGACRHGHAVLYSEARVKPMKPGEAQAGAVVQNKLVWQVLRKPIGGVPAGQVGDRNVLAERNDLRA